MGEGRPEKLKKVDIIQNYINEQVKKAGDSINPSPYRFFSGKTEKFIPEVRELFEDFVKKDFKAAQPKLDLADEKIEGIKDEEIRKINKEFVALFNQDIKNGIDTEENQEVILKDKI